MSSDLPNPEANRPEAAAANSRLSATIRMLKRALIAMVGGTVLLIGIALIVLPGPAFVVIPIGLAILAIEFAWAKRLLTKARDMLRRKSPAQESKEPQ